MQMSELVFGKVQEHVSLVVYSEGKPGFLMYEQLWVTDPPQPSSVITQHAPNPWAHDPLMAPPRSWHSLLEKVE